VAGERSGRDAVAGERSGRDAVAGERSGRDAGTGQPSGRDATAGQRLDADDPENASSPARASAGEPPLRGEGGAAPATGAAERGAKLPGLRSGSPDAGAALFGPYLEAAHRYAELLADTGISHGLLGPHEADRVWDRHVMNCGVLAELIEPNARVLDLGSGGGLPGIPLALARPDLEIVLLEPLERRTAWLRETVETIAPSVRVVRGRAEEPAIRRAWSGADIVTARAVAPLNRLAAWAMPLLRLDGRLLAIKGASAHEEAARDRAAVGRCGGSTPRVVRCGSTHVDPPTTVVVVRRTAARLGPREPRPGRRRQR
jgi:16S rRNA (guanine527-N7)-methyltransferase